MKELTYDDGCVQEIAEGVEVQIQETRDTVYAIIRNTSNPLLKPKTASCSHGVQEVVMIREVDIEST